MVRLLSFFIASLAATCSVLGALQPGRRYTISYGAFDLTLPSPNSPATFEPARRAPNQQWIVRPSGKQNEWILQSLQFGGNSLFYPSTAPSTPLGGGAPAPFIAIEQPGEQYILYPSSTARVTVSGDRPGQPSRAILKSTDSGPAVPLTFKLVA